MNRPLTNGEVISGKYRLVREIGEGAMGTVWVAHNNLLDVEVALKLMRFDNPRSDPNNLYQRLLQEARAAARLGHPAIVRIFDFGRTEDGTPFIVMELLKGESLADLMEREGRIDEQRAIQMMLPIADALSTAHGRGIVHRDIKPENIFIACDDYGRFQPKIVDFGVARFAEGGRTISRPGALMGTPDYMAPEQARGEPDVDHRVDVWALCVVLYEMMVGQRPFGEPGANYLAVLRAIVHEPTRPITDYGIGDSALWLVLERGLRKRRQERWDTMRVFGEALALWLYERGVREDAYGASLKTGWLQSGIDGVKIETGSTVPPPPADFGVDWSESLHDRDTAPAPQEPVSDSGLHMAASAPPSAESGQSKTAARGRSIWPYIVLITCMLLVIGVASAVVVKLTSWGELLKTPGAGADADARVSRVETKPGPIQHPAVQASADTQAAAEPSATGAPAAAATSATVPSPSKTSLGQPVDRPEVSAVPAPSAPPVRRAPTKGAAQGDKRLPSPSSFDFGF
jgi:serine/threonine-protein kinase